MRSNRWHPRGQRHQEITRPGVVLGIVSLGLVLANIDLFVVNVALPSIAADLHPSDLGELSWTLNAYAIVFAALLVPIGRLADRTSRRGGFLLGVAIFTVASAACAVSTTVPMLVAFRVVQAIGAATMLPTSLGLVLDAYPPERRFGAVRIWAAVSSSAVAVSPIVAGPLTAASWRWIFLINLPIGAVALIAGWRRLPRTKGEGGPMPDVIGAGLLTAGIAALTLALIKSADWGWSSGRVIGSLLASAVLITVFLGRSSRHPSPIFEIGLLRNRSFAVATLATMLFSTALGGMLLSNVLWVQNVWHWSALESGLAILPGPALVPIWSALAGKLMPRLGAGPIVIAGAIAFAAGVAWWSAAVRLDPNYFTGMFGGMALTGVGVGLALPTLFGAAASSLPRQRFATGSGVLNMIRQIGLTMGVAVLIAMTGTPGTLADQLTAFQHAWLAFAAIALIAGATAYLLRRPRPAAQAPPTPDMVSNVTADSDA